jgi:hypothetical protein
MMISHDRYVTLRTAKATARPQKRINVKIAVDLVWTCCTDFIVLVVRFMR